MDEERSGMMSGDCEQDEEMDMTIDALYEWNTILEEMLSIQQVQLVHQKSVNMRMSGKIDFQQGLLHDIRVCIANAEAGSISADLAKKLIAILAKKVP